MTLTTNDTETWRPIAEEFKQRAVEVLGDDEDDQVLDLEELVAYVDHLCGDDDDDGAWRSIRTHEAENFAFELLEMLHYAQTIRLLCDEDDEDARRRIIEESIASTRTRMEAHLVQLRDRADATRDELKARREARTK